MLLRIIKRNPTRLRRDAERAQVGSAHTGISAATCDKAGTRVSWGEYHGRGQVRRFQTHPVNTKTPIIRFLAEKLPDFLFDEQSRPNLVFRHCQPNGLLQCVAVQRDSKSHGLAPNLAVTYSPFWRGEPAVPLGIDRGFPQLRQKNRVVPAMDYWYFYDPTPAGLLSTLQTILADFHALAVPFFAQTEAELLGNKLLQTALREASAIPPESRVGLPEALAGVGYIVAKCEHPAFLALRDRIRAAWTDDVSKEQRQWTNRLAYDTLVFV